MQFCGKSVTHISVREIIIIGSDNGLSPGQRQAIIWTNAGILLIGPLVTNFNEIFTNYFFQIRFILSSYIMIFSTYQTFFFNLVIRVSSVISDPYQTDKMNLYDLMIIAYIVTLVLGDFYVFSLFLLTCTHPLQTQWLLLLTSKLFKPNLRYLGQRKYRWGEMYWMTILWPWPKVKSVALINKNVFVYKIN